MHIALMGTRGLPPRYGGFETAIDEIGRRLVTAGHEVTVYCRNPGQEITHYEGMRLVNVPCLRRRATETLSHMGLSSAHALMRSRPDVAFVFNAANAPFVPLLRAGGVPVALHVDGLESQRGKWKGLGAAYYRRAEAWSVRWSDAVIADAVAIADHLRDAYGVQSEFIPYGASIGRPGHAKLAQLGLDPGGYHLVVARFEPENHVDVVVRGYVESEASWPLVVVGSAPYNDAYTTSIQKDADGHPGVRLLGSVWDQDLLDQLYAGAGTYFHGHSVGGTNPSLLRALGAGAPVAAYDVVFNREVTGGHAYFFRDVADVAGYMTKVESDRAPLAVLAEQGRRHVAEHYDWDQVARDYADLAARLHRRRGRRRSRPAR